MLLFNNYVWWQQARLAGVLYFYAELWKYVDDAVDEAFRVIPASRRTGPWSHRPPTSWSNTNTLLFRAQYIETTVSHPVHWAVIKTSQISNILNCFLGMSSGSMPDFSDAVQGCSQTYFNFGCNKYLNHCCAICVHFIIVLLRYYAGIIEYLTTCQNMHVFDIIVFFSTETYLL